MKLTDSLIEQMIAEALTEASTKQIPFSDIKYVSIGASVYESSSPGKFDMDGKSFTDAQVATLIKSNFDSGEEVEITDKNDYGYAKDYKTNWNNGQYKSLADLMRLGIDFNVAPPPPPALNLVKFQALIDDVIKAATGTDQTIVDTAKTNLNTYYSSFQTAADTKMAADAPLKANYDKAVAAKAKFNFTNFKIELDKVTNATDLSTLAQAVADLKAYYTANQTVIDGDPAELAKYNAAITSVPVKKKAIQNAGFKKKIDDATILAANTGAGETSLKASKQNLIDTNTTDPDFKQYVLANQADYDAAIKALEDAIDLIANKWKQPGEAIGIETPADIDPSSTKTYTDPSRDKILKALQGSFGTLIPPADLKMIAGLSEGKERFLAEGISELELSDIEKYIDNLLTKPKPTSTEMDLAKKVNDSLNQYINSIKEPARARKLNVAKKQYDDLVAKSKGYVPSKSTKYSTTDRAITTTQAGGATMTRIDPIIMKSFNIFFENKTTFKDKLQHLENFSDAIMDASKGRPTSLDGFAPEIIICGGNVLSNISRITRQIDPSAGGFFAEAFLAYLAGGVKTGQLGGAGDFTDVAGNQFSSKWGESSDSQAVSNFNPKGNSAKDKTITYVTAIKTTLGGAGTTDTPSITKVELKIYDIWIVDKPVADATGVITTQGKIKKGAVGFGGSSGTVAMASKPLGSNIGTAKNASFGKYDVSPPTVASSFTLKFVTAKDEIFDDIFSKAISQVSSNLVKAAAQFTAQSKKLEEETTSYSVSGNFAEGVMMADTYKDIKTTLKLIISEQGQQVSNIGLTESKMQTLDSLIAEAMRDIKKSRK